MCLIDYQIPKTAGLACLEGLLNLLFIQVEGLADFGEILVFICETLKTRRGEFARAAMVIESVQSLLSSTGLVFMFSTGNLVYARMILKTATAVLKNLCLIGYCVSVSAK